MVNKFVKNSVILAIVAGIGVSASVFAQQTDVISGHNLCWESGHDSNEYWKSAGTDPARCGVKPEAPQAEVNPTPVPPKRVYATPVKIEADTNFKLGKHTLTPLGSSKVADLGNQLKDSDAKYIVVEGHADRLGRATSNLRLSQRRANTVKAALVRQGVPADKIVTFGRGEAESNASSKCRDMGREIASNKRLVECLAEFRRVDVSEADELPSDSSFMDKAEDMYDSSVNAVKSTYKKAKGKVKSKAKKYYRR